MKSFFSRNIGKSGRLLRGATAIAFIAAGAMTFSSSRWLAVALCVLGGFVLFEALRGWCFLRACGIKTKL